MPNGNMRISLKGLNRCIIQTIKEEDMVYEATINIVEKEEIDHRIEHLLEDYAEVMEKEDGVVANGDIVQFSPISAYSI